ncbi:MAG: hypothetical protein AAF830_01500 [Pseudomonadota bacterium]
MIGFATSRFVKAVSLEEAMQGAIEEVLAEWTEGTWAEVNEGSVPTVVVDSVYSVSLISRLFRRLPTGGYTFFDTPDETSN